MKKYNYMKKHNMSYRKLTKEDFAEWLTGGNWTEEELEKKLNQGYYILSINGNEWLASAEDLNDTTTLATYLYFANI